MADFTAAAQPAQQSDLHAFIALAKDPDGFAAKLSQLKAAQEAADEALVNARAAQQELGAEKNALNARAVAVEKQAAKNATDSAALDKAREEFATMAAGRLAEMDQRNRDLNARENDLAARTAATEEVERSTAALNRQAQSDRDAASALLARLRGIAAELAPLEAKIAALG